MYKKISLALALIITVISIPMSSYGFTNPLKSYNLYEDTHKQATPENSERETVMSDYYNNSLRAPKTGDSSSASSSSNSDVPSNTPNFDEHINNYTPQETNPTGRNQTLRNSSRNVYGNPNQKGAWEEGPYFYRNPSLESIKTKYKQSNFAGCMQEAEAYVRQNPNDTLGFYYLAMSYAKVNDRENAIKAYEKVIALRENPMIVKYATNGRNCVLGNSNESCYPNVNEPELVYPYANITANLSEEDLKPINPRDLINRNISGLQSKLVEGLNISDENGESSEDNQDSKGSILPFRNQDADLDKFINAPYGNGLSPELNNEYKTIQLKKFQQNMNNNENLKNNFYNNIKKFDRGSDSGLAKLAYIDPSNLNKLSQDSEYQEAQKELEAMRMLLGNNNSNKNDRDFLDLLLSGDTQKMPPEVVQTMMMQSVTSDLIGNN